MKVSTSKRGFASMDAQKQREIARKGGRSVPDEKRSFRKIANSLRKPAAKAATRPSATGTQAERRVSPLIPQTLSKSEWFARSMVRLCSIGSIRPMSPAHDSHAMGILASEFSKRRSPLRLQAA
jgi:uncharacterized protein